MQKGRGQGKLGASFPCPLPGNEAVRAASGRVNRPVDTGRLLVRLENQSNPGIEAVEQTEGDVNVLWVHCTPVEIHRLVEALGVKEAHYLVANPQLDGFGRIPPQVYIGFRLGDDGIIRLGSLVDRWQVLLAQRILG